MSSTRLIAGAELVGQGYVFLLEIEWDGYTFRWSTEPGEIAKADGSKLLFNNGMDVPEIDDEMDLMGDTPRQASVSMELMFPCDVAALVAGGHDLATATGELSVWVAGRTYEQRITLVKGKLSEPVHGDRDQPVAFTIEQALSEDRALYPGPDAVISRDTWTTAPEKSLGRPYVTVLGQPGFFILPDGTELKVPGSPAFLVNQPTDSTELASIRLMVAGHHCVEGTAIVHNKTLVDAGVDADVYQRTLTVVNEYDALGQEVAVIYLDGEDSVDGWWADLDGDYWIIWAGTAAGMQNVTRTGPLVGAGEVMRMLFKASTVELDSGRLAVAEHYLNQYKLCGFLNEPEKPFTLIQDHLLSILPVTVMAGRDGFFPVIWRPDATERDAVAHLVAPNDMERDDGDMVEYDRDYILNEIRVTYCVQGDDDKPKQTYTLSGDPKATSRAYHCELSHKRHGLKADKLDMVLVSDNVTARRVAMARTRAFCFSRRSVRYTVKPKWAKLSVGDIVTITDPRLHFNRQVAWVKHVGLRAYGISMTFLIISNPVTDKRIERGAGVWDGFDWDDGSSWS